MSTTTRLVSAKYIARPTRPANCSSPKAAAHRTVMANFPYLSRKTLQTLCIHIGRATLLKLTFPKRFFLHTLIPRVISKRRWSAYARTSTYVQGNKHTCARTHTHACTHAHTHRHSHTHTHTRVHARKLSYEESYLLHLKKEKKKKTCTLQD